MKEIDVQELSKSAESGRGCEVSMQIREMAFEESIKTLNQIVVENAKHRALDSSLPKLYFASGGISYEPRVYAEIGIDRGIGRQREFLTEDTVSYKGTKEYGLGTRKHKCKEFDPKH